MSLVCYCGVNITSRSGLQVFDDFMDSWATQVDGCPLYLSIYTSNLLGTLNVLAKYEQLQLTNPMYSNVTQLLGRDHWTYLSEKWPQNDSTWILFDQGLNIWQSVRIKILKTIIPGVTVETCIYCPRYLISPYLSEEIINPYAISGVIPILTDGTDVSHFLLLGPYSAYVIADLQIYLQTQIGTAYEPNLIVLPGYPPRATWLFNRVSDTVFGIN